MSVEPDGLAVVEEESDGAGVPAEFDAESCGV